MSVLSLPTPYCGRAPLGQLAREFGVTADSERDARPRSTDPRNLGTLASSVMEALIFIVRTLLQVLLVTVFLLRVLLPLVRADSRNQLSQAVIRLTNPLVLPLRRILAADRQGRYRIDRRPADRADRRDRDAVAARRISGVFTRGAFVSVVLLNLLRPSCSSTSSACSFTCC